MKPFPGIRSAALICVMTVMGVSELAGQSTEADSSTVRTIEEKNPGTAMLRSAVLPGWGQMYNGQWFKSILVFGLESGLAVNAVVLNQKAVASSTEDERLFYADQRGLSIWWLVGVHLLNILDAFVDAHLWNFDTGPDLSFSGPSACGEMTLMSFKWSF